MVALPFDRRADVDGPLGAGRNEDDLLKQPKRELPLASTPIPTSGWCWYESDFRITSCSVLFRVVCPKRVPSAPDYPRCRAPRTFAPPAPPTLKAKAHHDKQ